MAMSIYIAKECGEHVMFIVLVPVPRAKKVGQSYLYKKRIYKIPREINSC